MRVYSMQLKCVCVCLRIWEEENGTHVFYVAPSHGPSNHRNTTHELARTLTRLAWCKHMNADERESKPERPLARRIHFLLCSSIAHNSNSNSLFLYGFLCSTFLYSTLTAFRSHHKHWLHSKRWVIIGCVELNCAGESFFNEQSRKVFFSILFYRRPYKIHTQWASLSEAHKIGVVVVV